MAGVRGVEMGTQFLLIYERRSLAFYPAYEEWKAEVGVKTLWS